MENNPKNAVLNALDNKTIDTVSNKIILEEKGYLPAKNLKKISWYDVLSRAYNRINNFSDSQQQSLNSLYNKLLHIK